jgi:hypothetical protein
MLRDRGVGMNLLAQVFFCPAQLAHDPRQGPNEDEISS